MSCIVGTSNLARAAGSTTSSGYSVPIDIHDKPRNGWNGAIKGKFLASTSQCVNASNFSVPYESGCREDQQVRATSFEIDTGSRCFTKFAKVVYEIGVDTGDVVHGPIDLAITQIGPRYFITSCTDKYPIDSSCRVNGAPIKPTIYLHI